MSNEVVNHDAPKSDVEQSDRGWFDFFGKKKEENKCDENAISSEFEEKVQVSEPEHNETSLEKIQQSRDDGSSSSSINEKLPGGHKKVEEEHVAPDPPPPVSVVTHEAEDEAEHKEKKGIIEKIKEKIPGYNAKSGEEKSDEVVIHQPNSTLIMSNEVVNHDAPKSDVEQSDRGWFDFFGKKKEENKCDENAISSEFEEKVQVSEPEHKETSLEKIHQSRDDGSSSSSLSDEECENGEKKKKPLKETIKEKTEKKEEKKIEEDMCVPIEKYEEVAVSPSTTEVVHPIPTPEPEEKKEFIEKINEKLPGGHKKVEEEDVAPAPPPPVSVVTHEAEDEAEHKEKKGIIENIKEKIPVYNAKSREEKSDEVVVHQPNSTLIMSNEVVNHDAPKSDVEQSDRGLFDFIGKKKEENKCDENAISSEIEEKVQVSEPEHKETLLDKIHQSRDDSSTSSSDEECENGEKKKKKKPLKETIKEKTEKKEEKKIEEDMSVPIEKYEEVAVSPSTTEVVHPIPTPEPEEKKEFIEKINEKLPSGQKKVEEEHVAPAPSPPVSVVTHEAEDEAEHKEKKGIIMKIKEKIPGYNAKIEKIKEKIPGYNANIEKIKEKIPGYNAKSGEEKEKVIRT